MSNNTSESTPSGTRQLKLITSREEPADCRYWRLSVSQGYTQELQTELYDKAENATMHTFKVERELNVPIEKLWTLVSDFSNLSWYSPAEKVEKVGSGVGEIRRITMPGMPTAIEERLLELDPQQHQLVYEVLENEINIMRDYTVKASLRGTGTASTIAIWHGQFTGVSGDVEPQVMIDIMTDTYGSMLTEMERAAT
jgi:hypothetical protein